MNNDWKKKTETLLNRAWSRGTNWAIKGFGYSMDTDVEAEIDEVNNLIQSLLDKQKQEERENGEFMVIAYDYEVGNTVQISIVLDSYQEALSFKESEYQKKENPNARVVKILEELKN